MPYTMRKLPNKDLYRITNSTTGQVHCKSCTKENAKKQLRLLNYIDHVPLRNRGGSNK
jgi:hypothetical protein